jgi:dihydroorotate dehydrogenase electron transfer subunit
MRAKINNYKIPIVEIKESQKNIFNIKFKEPSLAATAKPGQFIEVLSKATFLRRPFCLHRVKRKTGVCEILFKKLGAATSYFSGLKSGDIIDINAPLGNGFEFKKAKTHIIAGGGMGIAPLLFLAEELYNKGENVKIFLAAKTAEELPCSGNFRLFGNTVVSTEDGSLGEQCMIDTPLERELKLNSNAAIYACGPQPMFLCVSKLAQKYKVSAQVSLEERMACGIGVCRGCPVEVKNKDVKYKMVCKDGPVFDTKDIVW